MVANDYWTHVGLALTFLVVLVGPRMFQSDYASFTTFYLVGASVLVVVATFIRLRSKAAERAAATSTTPVEP